MSREEKKRYKHISFRENTYRLKVLAQFLDLVKEYFEKSRLNMLSGDHHEGQEAKEARAAINLLMNEAYKIIRQADVKPFAASTPSLAVRGNCQNIDLIRNIFNLGRNDIPSSAAVDNIEKAIDVYKSNRVSSLFRTLNPFFWISILVHHIAGRFRKEQKQTQDKRKMEDQDCIPTCDQG